MPQRFLIAAVAVAAFALSAFVSQPAVADECGPPPASDAELLARPDVAAAIEEAGQMMPNATGRIFRVETEPASYLIGTFHLPGAGVEEPGPVIADIVAGATSVHLELNEKALRVATGRMVLDPTLLLRDDGGRLSDGLNAEERAAVEALFEAYGIPFFLADTMKPAFLWVFLSIPPCANATWPPAAGLDARLDRLAREHGVTAQSIETIDEQIGALDFLPAEDAEEVLRVSLLLADHALDNLHIMRALYRSGEIGAVWMLSVAQAQAAMGDARGAAITHLMWEGLVARRNVRMVERTLPALREGGAVVAVGALHLPGEDGIVALLREEGFDVTVVRE